MANDWGRPFTPEELEKLPGAKQVTTAWPDYQQAPKPIDPTPAKLTDTPEELAAKGWVQTAHDEWEKIAPDTSPFAGSKVTMKRIDADFDMLIVDETHFEPPTAADWGSEPAFVGGTITGRKDWSIPDINGDDWPTHPDQLSPMTVEQQEPEPVKPQSELTKALNTIMAPGFGEPEPRTAPVETYSEADGPWYVVYFGPVLYTVLAGPYDTQDDAAARLDIVWGQFEHDAAYDFTFPVRERSGLRAATVRTVYNLKGAYGKQ